MKTPKKSDGKKIINGLFRNGLIDEKEYEEEVEDLDVAEMVLEKEEEENLVEHFLALQIDETRAATPMEVE